MKELYPINLYIKVVFIIAPVLQVIVGLVYPEWNVGYEILPLFIIFGMVLAWPALIIVMLIYVLLIRKITSPILVKVIIGLVIIASIFITFAILKGSMAFMLSLVYSGSVIIAIIITRISQKDVKLVEMP